MGGSEGERLQNMGKRKLEHLLQVTIVEASLVPVWISEQKQGLSL